MALRTLDVADGFASASTPSVIANPAQYIQDTVTTTVNADSTTPANNKPMPSAVYGKRADGTYHSAALTDNDELKVSVTAAIEVEMKNDTGNPLPVNGTVTANLGTINGIATDSTLSAMSAKLPATLGAKTTANSISVNIASDQTVPVSGSFSIPGVSTETTLAAMSAKLPATLGAKTTANSISIALPTDLAALATKSPVNTNGTIVNTTLTGTTATANTPPANAIGFMIEADSSNSDNIRWAIGSTASTTVGFRLEAGRDAGGFIPCAASVSVCAEASTVSNKYIIQWILSA